MLVGKRAARHAGRMKLRDYFLGQRVRLRSSLSKDEVAERIKKGIGQGWWPLANGIKGGVFADRMRLRYVETWLFAYNAQPILVGKLQDNLGSCEFTATFRAPAFTYIFFAVWYLFLGLIILGLIGVGMTRGIEPNFIPFLFSLVLFLAAPVAMHYVFTRNSDRDLQTMLAWLEREAGLSAI